MSTMQTDGWMRTSFNLNRRATTFTLSLRSILGKKLYESWHQRASSQTIGTPEYAAEISRLAEELILSVRPQLRGMVVYYVGFDAYQQQWVFSVSHGSLPEVGIGNSPEEVPLERDEIYSDAETTVPVSTPVWVEGYSRVNRRANDWNGGEFLRERD